MVPGVTASSVVCSTQEAPVAVDAVAAQGSVKASAESCTVAAVKPPAPLSWSVMRTPVSSCSSPV